MMKRSCLVHLASYLIVVAIFTAWFMNSDWLWNTPDVGRDYFESYAEGHVRNGNWTRAEADERLAHDYWGRQGMRTAIVLVGTGLVAFIYVVARHDELLR